MGQRVPVARRVNVQQRRHAAYEACPSERDMSARLAEKQRQKEVVAARRRALKANEALHHRRRDLAIFSCTLTICRRANEVGSVLLKMHIEVRRTLGFWGARGVLGRCASGE